MKKSSKQSKRPQRIPLSNSSQIRPTQLQPLVDRTAWDLIHRKKPFLARAVYHLLESGQPTAEVIQTIRSSCPDLDLRPFLACAVYGCNHLRNVDRLSLFDDPTGLVH